MDLASLFGLALVIIMIAVGWSMYTSSGSGGRSGGSGGNAGVTVNLPSMDGGSQATFGEQEVNILPSVVRRVPFGVVPAGTYAVFERLGTFSPRTVGNRRRFLGRIVALLPVFWWMHIIPARQLSLVSEEEHVSIKDGLELALKVLVRFKIVDPYLFMTVLEDTNYRAYVQNLARELAANEYRQAMTTDYADIRHVEAIRTELTKEMEHYGMELIGIEVLTNITPEHAKTFAIRATDSAISDSRELMMELISDTLTNLKEKLPEASDDELARQATAIVGSMRWPHLQSPAALVGGGRPTN